MLKRAILTFSVILSMLVYCETSVFAANKNEIIQEQTTLSKQLKDADLGSLIYFSEFDFYYDNKLYYNTEMSKLIENLSTADNHFKKSNVAVSYHEYKSILKTMKPNDFYYMLLAYRLSQIGFFSLSHEAMSKVEDREIWQPHTTAIRNYCFPKVPIKIPEEVFFAELLADIVYNNMTDESLKKLEKSEKVLLNSDYASYIRSKAYFTEKKYKKALNEINKALEQNPNNVNFLKFKAEILGVLNKNSEAIKTINLINKDEVLFVETHKNIEKIKSYTLSSSSKKEEEKKYNLAYYFYLNKDYQRAINELNALILKGETSKSPELLGYIYKINEKFEDAEKLYDKYIAKNKKNSFAHKGKGDILLKAGKYKNALEEYKSAYKYNKNDIETLIALTVTSYKTGDLESSLKYLKKAQKKDMNNFKVLYLSSKLTQDTGKQYLKLSLQHNPFYPESWLDLAESALNTNDTDSAEAYINTAAFITKDSPRYFYYKSILNLQKGQIKTAEEDIHQAKILTIKKEQQLHEEI